jgi:hypothetical protein
MTLRLRNTLTRRVEPVEPREPGRVGMYSCGPTVYRYAHVGNLRTFLLADLIRRTLVYHGVEVFHVQNITDVGHLRDERFDRGEDRMLVAAGLEDKTPQEIANAYEAAFHEDAARLNLLPAHVFPRATEHIPEMVELAEQLVDKGHAYETDHRNVYYAVATFPSYGRLSGNQLDDLRAGHRGHVEHDKRDPADFALWKSAGEGRLLKWPTARWGDGFPGWHLECSAMALDPHVGRRLRQRLPAPRRRDRAERPDRRRAAGQRVGPWCAPPDGRPEDGQVGRQLPARHGARRRWSRPARVPLPVPDGPLWQAPQLLGGVARRGRVRPRVAAQPAAGTRSAAGRWFVGGA